MDYKYIKHIIDEMNDDLLKSCYASTATLFLVSTPVWHDSMTQEMSGSLDGRQNTAFQKNYRKDLPVSLHVTVYVIERTLSRYESNSVKDSLIARFQPFDIWLACSKQDIKINEDETYLNYLEYVQFGSKRFKLKSKTFDTSGNKEVAYLFLVKDSEV
jgi:hypothetical protein